MNTTRQRVALNNLTEPQQLRELNRQLEWVWSQLMGGLTRKALSAGLNNVIESKAEQEEVDELTGAVQRQGTLIQQNAAAIALKAGRETVDDLGQRLDAAEAEIALLPDSISLAVGGMEIGAANLVTESATFKDAAFRFEGADGTARLITMDGAASGRAAQIGFTNKTGTTCAALWQPFTGVEGQSYTWSFLGRYSGGEIQVDAGHESGGVTAIRMSAAWTKYSHTWVYHGASPAFVWRGPFDESEVLYISDFKIESGDKATDWTSAPGELFAGTSVAITKDRFHVETSEFEIDVPGGESFHLDADGGSMDNLTVNRRLIAPNIAEKYAGAALITAGPNGDFAGLQEALNALNDRVLSGAVTLRLLGDFYESATLGGLTGRGSLTIQGQSHALSGGLTITGCGCPVRIESLKVTGTGDDPAVLLAADSHVRLYDVTVNGSGAYEAVSVTDGTSAELTDCALYNAVSLLYAGPNASLCCTSLCGGDGAYALTASGARWVWSGTRPDGMYDEITACLHSPADLTALPVAPGDAESQAEPPALLTCWLPARLAGTNAGGSSWMSEDAMRQGRYDSTQYAGCMWFNVSGLAGKTVRSAALTLTRASGAGGSSPVAVTLYTTPVTGRSGNPLTGAVSFGQLGSIGNGETKEFALPAAAVQALCDGTAGALMLYAGDTALRSGRRYSANYAKFDGDPVLTVVYQ